MACQKNNCTGMEVGSGKPAEEGLGGYGGVGAMEEGGAISGEHDGK